MTQPPSLTLRQPDDWHVHLRDGAALAAVAAHTARQFARAIVMPNLKPPVTTVAAAATIAPTITPQHLLWSRNALLVGGIRPHFYCLPILKRETHREALVAAATSGNPRYFLGTDSAPHARHTKENACGCAGCYS